MKRNAYFIKIALVIVLFIDMGYQFGICFFLLVWWLISWP